MFGLRYRGEYHQAVEDEFENLTSQITGFLLKSFNADGTPLTAPASLATVPVGGMMDWPAADAPVGWLLCEGQQVSRVTYNALYVVIGTTYGPGDGSLTFNVPDRRGRFSMGKTAAGTGSTLGATGGSLDHTHTGPSHTHTGPSHSHSLPTQAIEGQAGTGFNVTSLTAASTGNGGTGATGASGTGATGSANPPYLALNSIIYAGV